MAIKVEYEGTPVYGRRRAEARVEIGVLGITGYGETHEEARVDLWRKVRAHQADVAHAIEAIEASEAPKVEPTR